MSILSLDLLSIYFFFKKINKKITLKSSHISNKDNFAGTAVACINAITNMFINTRLD